jgi:transposase-like protein
MNTAVKAERQQYLGAAAYQHSPERLAHGNGYKPKTLSTRLGETAFAHLRHIKGDFAHAGRDRFRLITIGVSLTQ